VLKVHDQNGVRVLTLARPERLNALNPELLQALLRALKEAARDAAVRAVMLVGEGRAFSAGQDLEAVPRDRNYAQVLADYIPVVEALFGLEKPTVAAVNGVAAGAGMSLALACDLRVMARGAFFSPAFVRVGLVPDAGMSFFLPRLVGLGRALDWCFRSPRIGPEEAHAAGLVSEVFPDEGFLEAALGFAAGLATGPTRALALTKRLLWRNLESALADALAYEAASQQVAGTTEDHTEGLRAFLEKRPPAFRGR